MICERSIEIWVTAVNSAVSISIICFFLFTANLVYASRKSFHPFFVILFISLLFSYMLCDLFAVVMNVSQCAGLKEDHVVPKAASILSTIFYRNATPTIISLLMERLYATKNCGTYEKARPWSLFVPLQPIGLLLAIADAFIIFHQIVSKNGEQYSLGGVYIIVFLMLCLLLFVNKRLTSQYAGRGIGLTARYQLSENIRVLRLVIPVVVMDGLITVENILGQLIFGVNKQFEAERCDAEASYLTLFIIVNIMSSLMELCIPLSIIYGHPAISRLASQYMCFPQTSEKEERSTRIKNVLGLDLQQTQTANEYFNNLQTHWQ